MSEITEQKKQKITIRLTHDIVRKMERYKNVTKSEIIQVAVEQWIERQNVEIKEKNLNHSKKQTKRYRRIINEDERCLSAWGRDDSLRCGLKKGHEGPHIFFCPNPECPGHTYPHTKTNPHSCSRRK